MADDASFVGTDSGFDSPNFTYGDYSNPTVASSNSNLSLADEFKIGAAIAQIGSSMINYQVQSYELNTQAFNYGSDIKTLRLQAASQQALRGYQLQSEQLNLQSENVNYTANSTILGLQKDSLTAQFADQRSQLAIQQGDVRLATADATKAARINSAQVAFSNAGGGSSAFTKAYSQMSVNARATLDQKMQGLKAEGLLNQTEYNIGIDTFSAKSTQLNAQHAINLQNLYNTQQTDAISYNEQQAEFSTREKAAEVAASNVRKSQGANALGGIVADVGAAAAAVIAGVELYGAFAVA